MAAYTHTQSLTVPQRHERFRKRATEPHLEIVPLGLGRVENLDREDRTSVV
jgi:hypothetical protein